MIFVAQKTSGILFVLSGGCERLNTKIIDSQINHLGSTHENSRLPVITTAITLLRPSIQRTASELLRHHYINHPRTQTNILFYRLRQE